MLAARSSQQTARLAFYCSCSLDDCIVAPLIGRHSDALTTQRSCCLRYSPSAARLTAFFSRCKLMQTARYTSHLQAAFYVLFLGTSNLSILVPPSQLQWTGQAYQASAQLSTAGSYEVAIRRGASHISASPFQLTVLPGATAATASMAWGTGLAAAVAGAPAGVMVQVTGSHASCSNDVPAASLLGCQGGQTANARSRTQRASNRKASAASLMGWSLHSVTPTFAD